MVDRVRRPKKYEELMTNLKDSGSFETLKDVLVYAASLGLQKNTREEFKETSEPINLHIFSGTFDVMVLNLIAIKESGDPRIMANERSDDRVKIFEEYACGGLGVIDNHFQGSGDIVETLTGLIMQVEAKKNTLDEIVGLAN
jgi:dnd system-associated protein 4